MQLFDHLKKWGLVSSLTLHGAAIYQALPAVKESINEIISFLFCKLMHLR